MYHSRIHNPNITKELTTRMFSKLNSSVNQNKYDAQNIVWFDGEVIMIIIYYFFIC